MTKHILYLLSICLFFTLGCEENRIEPVVFGVIAGTVVDDASGLPISGVTLSTSPASDVIASATDGSFIFDKVPDGSALVRAELNGYVNTNQSVTVYEKDTAFVTLHMKESTGSNVLPSVPSYLLPSNGSINHPTDSVLLKWNASIDANKNDIVNYHVVLFAPGQTPDTVATSITDTCLLLNQLKYGTDYTWQVIATDTSKIAVFGQVWRFSTRQFPDNPILFARNTGGTYHIWSAKVDGSDQVQLTNLSANQWRPRRNAQRTRIAFLADMGIQTGLYTMANDGSDVQMVTMLPVSGFNDLDLDFCWSPDGSKLLFMAGNKLYTVSPNGSGLAVFATAPTGFTYTEVDWAAPTNTVLARLTGAQIYESQFIRYGPTGLLQAIELLDQPGSEGGPALSITGDRFLYTHDLSSLNSADGRQLDARIFIRTLGTSTEFDASISKAAGTNDLDPRYSANGAQIIFVNVDNTGLGLKNIYTITLAGIGRKLLISNAEMPDWE